jgi:hypothetical protein
VCGLPPSDAPVRPGRQPAVRAVPGPGGSDADAEDSSRGLEGVTRGVTFVSSAPLSVSNEQAPQVMNLRGLWSISSRSVAALPPHDDQAHGPATDAVGNTAEDMIVDSPTVSAQVGRGSG